MPVKLSSMMAEGMMVCLPVCVCGRKICRDTDGRAGVRTGAARPGVGARAAWTGRGGGQKSAWATSAHLVEWRTGKMKEAPWHLPKALPTWAVIGRVGFGDSDQF